MTGEQRHALREAKKKALATPGTNVFEAVVAAAGGDVRLAQRFLMEQPQQSNPHKRARSIAFAEARRQDLWKKGEGHVFTWWRKLLSIIPPLRKRYLNFVGRIFRSNVKRWQHEAYRYLHDGSAERDQKERRQFARLQRKAADKRMHEAIERQARKAAEAKKEGSKTPA